MWRSVFFSALIGWFVLLAFLFAANDVEAVNDGAGFVGAIFTSALDSWAAKMILVIATIGQLFCGAAGPYKRFAHVVRLLARPRNARLGDLPPRE